MRTGPQFSAKMPTVHRTARLDSCDLQISVVVDSDGAPVVF